jgi:hypothetical protein
LPAVEIAGRFATFATLAAAPRRRRGRLAGDEGVG